MMLKLKRSSCVVCLSYSTFYKIIINFIFCILYYDIYCYVCLLKLFNFFFFCWLQLIHITLYVIARSKENKIPTAEGTAGCQKSVAHK